MREKTTNKTNLTEDTRPHDQISNLTEETRPRDEIPMLTGETRLRDQISRKNEHSLSL